MLRDFELGLADALGSQLPAPLAGAVDAAPARDLARVVVSVRGVEPVDDELLTRRPERAPGAADPRRVLRLHCETALEVRVPAGGTRADQVQALDRVLYLLGDPAFADGSALQPTEADADPGFLLQQLQLLRVESPAVVVLGADGWFWPVGTAGEAGVAIRELRLRQAALPLLLEPAAPRLVAGGAPVPLTLRLRAEGVLRLQATGPDRQPFGRLRLALTDAGGRPGAGVLSGGDAVAGGARSVEVADGAVNVQYTPPAAPGIDYLVVQLEDSALPLGRLKLAVRSA